MKSFEKANLSYNFVSGKLHRVFRMRIFSLAIYPFVKENMGQERFITRSNRPFGFDRQPLNFPACSKCTLIRLTQAPLAPQTTITISQSINRVCTWKIGHEPKLFNADTTACQNISFVRDTTCKKSEKCCSLNSCIQNNFHSDFFFTQKKTWFCVKFSKQVTFFKNSIFNYSTRVFCFTTL